MDDFRRLSAGSEKSTIGTDSKIQYNILRRSFEPSVPNKIKWRVSDMTAEEPKKCKMEPSVPNKIKWRVSDITSEEPKKCKRSIDIFRTLDIINRHLSPSKDKVSASQRRRNTDADSDTEKSLESKTCSESKRKIIKSDLREKPERMIFSSTFVASSRDNSLCDNESLYSFTGRKSQNVNSSRFTDSSVSDISSFSFSSPDTIRRGKREQEINFNKCSDDWTQSSLKERLYKSFEGAATRSFDLRHSLENIKSKSLNVSKDMCFESKKKRTLQSVGAYNKSYTTESDESIVSLNKTNDAISYDIRESNLRRKILKRIKKTRLYSSLLDIDKIYEEIEERIIGKHDEWIHWCKRRIFILGDSHTRFLVYGLQHLLPGFTIEAVCKPSAKSNQVISGMEDTISALTKDDFLILLCGTNDMWGESTQSAMNCIRHSLRRIQNTNILLCNVPRNYSEPDDSHVQDNILEFNRFLERIVPDYENTALVKLNKIKNKLFFTKHGLHFNADGKIKICEVIAHRLVDMIDKINS